MGDAAGAEAPRYERGTLTNAQGLAIATHTWACAGEAKGEAQARAARARAAAANAPALMIADARATGRS